MPQRSVLVHVHPNEVEGAIDATCWTGAIGLLHLQQCMKYEGRQSLTGTQKGVLITMPTTVIRLLAPQILAGPLESDLRVILSLAAGSTGDPQQHNDEQEFPASTRRRREIPRLRAHETEYHNFELLSGLCGQNRPTLFRRHYFFSTSFFSATLSLAL
jgi:hypothetical protein